MTPFSTPPTKSQILERITAYLVHSGGITAEEHSEIETAILDTLFTDRPLLGDIKEVACSGTYISANFETSGINIGRGKVGSERYGWAICNGYNLTIDKIGKVAIGYDPTNYTITTAGSNTGGNKTVTLDVTQIPPHTHSRPRGNDNNLGGGVNQYGWQAIDDLFGSYSTNITGGAGSTSTGNTTGGTTVAHDNMQPYIVTLFIQKIATPYA